MFCYVHLKTMKKKISEWKQNNKITLPAVNILIIVPQVKGLNEVALALNKAAVFSSSKNVFVFIAIFVTSSRFIVYLSYFLYVLQRRGP